MEMTKKRKAEAQSSCDHCAPINSQDIRIPILSLPDPALSRTFSFLPLNERVVFAMQLPSWKEEQTSDVMKTIIAAAPVESLDCLDLGEEVASNLTDCDLKHILTSIDAADNLKSLKLTHCFKIAGHGLQPLGASKVLERFDLSLVPIGFHPSAGMHGLLSIEAVLPVLNSIIDTERLLHGPFAFESHHCPLRYIQLPQKWRENLTEDLVTSLATYSRIGLVCKGCEDTDFSRGIADFLPRKVFEYRTCYQCMKHHCGSCYARSIMSNEDRVIGSCQRCTRTICCDCGTLESCSDCGDLLCHECRGSCFCSMCKLCSQCILQCIDCEERGYSITCCIGCNQDYCEDCSTTCVRCHKSFCEQCGRDSWGITTSCNHCQLCYNCAPKCADCSEKVCLCTSRCDECEWELRGREYLNAQSP